MTQLVELQRALPKFEAAGIKLYAISYDEVEGLAAFAKAQGIRFPLLSDRDSAVIRRFGILNTLIDPGEPLFYGVPYPGTYVVDETGVVVEKYFSRHIAVRESPETMIDGALGQILLGEDDPSSTGGDDDIRITAAFRGNGLTGGNRRRIVVRFELRPGLHIYREPLPEGMVPTTIEVRGPDGLIVEPPVLPPTEPLHLPALDTTLHVWSGTVDFAIPVYANSRLVPMLERLEKPSMTVDVSVRYQACDDQTCLIPQTRSLSLEVPLAGFLVPRIREFADSGQEKTSVSPTHMLALARRGLRRRPLRTLLFGFQRALTRRSPLA